VAAQAVDEDHLAVGDTCGQDDQMVFEKYLGRGFESR
jgi:hypothetical protein